MSKPRAETSERRVTSAERRGETKKLPATIFVGSEGGAEKIKKIADSDRPGGAAQEIKKSRRCSLKPGHEGAEDRSHAKTQRATCGRTNLSGSGQKRTFSDSGGVTEVHDWRTGVNGSAKSTQKCSIRPTMARRRFRFNQAFRNWAGEFSLFFRTNQLRNTHCKLSPIL